MKSGQSIYDTANVSTKDDIRRERLRPSKGVTEALQPQPNAKIQLKQKTGKRMKTKIDELMLQSPNIKALEPFIDLKYSMTTHISRPKKEVSKQSTKLIKNHTHAYLTNDALQTAKVTVSSSLEDSNDLFTINLKEADKLRNVLAHHKSSGGLKETMDPSPYANKRAERTNLYQRSTELSQTMTALLVKSQRKASSNSNSQLGHLQQITSRNLKSLDRH